MFKRVEIHRQTTPPEFLVDTAAYQGVSRQFEVVQQLVAKKLRRDQSVREQLTTEEPLRCAIETLFERHVRLEIVIAGWIDQAILEFHSSLQGDKRCLAKMVAKLDAYRPDQNGDICFYLADLDYSEVVATMISFENSFVDSKAYRHIDDAKCGPRNVRDQKNGN
jgi:hypothetical protein